MTEWYYADRQGQQQGPVQTEDLLALRNAGQIGMETLVWRNGMSGWQAFATIADEVLPAPAAAPQATTPIPPPAAAEPVADGSYSMYDVATPVARDDAQASDPYAAPRTQLGNDNGIHRDGHVVYAGFWKRVAAAFIDAFALGIPLALVMGLIGAITGAGAGYAFSARSSAFGHPGLTLVSYLLTAAMYGWFYSNTSLMATPGKLAVGIKVVRSSGEPISFLRGFARYWASFISLLLLFAGYIMVAFTDRKQALHDIICDTIVVDKWAYSEHPEWQDDTLGTVTKVVLGLGIALLVLVFFVTCTAAARLAGA